MDDTSISIKVSSSVPSLSMFRKGRCNILEMTIDI
jgi:hypothetical protein